LALWVDTRDWLGDLRRAVDRAQRAAYQAGTGIGVVGHQLDVFLIEPGSNRYLGRLCSFGRCPKGKPECFVPGYGAIPFIKRPANFAPRDDLLAPASRRDEPGARPALATRRVRVFQQPAGGPIPTDATRTR
jgi:hypothetical protein